MWHGYLLFTKPYCLTSGQWSTAITALASGLNADAASVYPSHRLHYAPAGVDGEQVILEANFADLTDEAVATIISTALSGAVSVETLTPEVKNKYRQLGGIGATHAESRLAAVSRVKSNWSARINRFVVISDVHLGWTWEYGDLDSIVTRINALAPDLVLNLGDTAHTSVASEYAAFAASIANLTMPIYTIPGNHDEGIGLDLNGLVADEVADYTEYDAAGYPRHFSVTLGDLQLIGFESRLIRLPDTPNNDGQIVQAELDYVAAELAALDGKTALLFTHFPFYSTSIGQTDIRILADTYNAAAYFNGHAHSNPSNGSIWYGVKNVNCPSCRGHSTGYGGFLVCDVYANRIEIDYVRAYSPFDAFGETSTPTGDEPNYYPQVVIWL